MGSRVLSLAKSKVGDPYVWGAAGPSAFDCSGLVVWAFKQLGVSLPHSSATLSTMGAPVAKGALQPGDLVFFYSPVSHVGIYAGNGMVLNATESGEPVQFSKLANMPFHNARRISH
jgi:cell wall-associated NlpC family hydrolase